MSKEVFGAAERVIFALRERYLRFGYTPYRMSKFEEYDLYSRNKDFLISDSVITFTDRDGKLMALKPDVTLSIIKNTRGLSGGEHPKTAKLFYNENVYRVSKGTNSFKEIMQAGVECIGDIDRYQIGEVLYLAAESLMCISERFVLAISDLDILLVFVERITSRRPLQEQIIRCVSEKNTHGIREICRDNDIPQEAADGLIALLGAYGKASEVLPGIRDLCADAGAMEEYDELCRAIRVFDGSDMQDNVHIDFSVVSDTGYYNGIIFKGFVSGVPGAVLSGGRYDRLMQKMHRRSRAIGFAVYLDMLDRLMDDDDGYDADIVLVYNDADCDPARLRRAAQRYIEAGRSVCVTKDPDPDLKYKERILYTEGDDDE